MLHVQKELAEIGLDEVVRKYALRVNDYGHKVILKYTSYDSPKGDPVTEECRGLVLAKDGWRVLSYPFRKFYNHGEAFAQDIDWATATAEEKLDGSMIQVYYDWHDGRWYAGTTGTANGEADTEDPDRDFNALFWSVLTDFQRSTLVPGLTYVFELCTPWNKVVVRHNESFVRLLMIRELKTLRELPTATVDDIAGHMMVARPKKYGRADLSDFVRRASELPFDDEGFIVVDAHMRRLKIKSAAYVRAHRLNDNGSSGSPKNMVEIIMLGEADELIVYFPERKRQIDNILGLMTAWKDAMNDVKREVMPVAADYFVGCRAFGVKSAWCRAERVRLNAEFSSRYEGGRLVFALLLLGNLSTDPDDRLRSATPKQVLEMIGYE
jgi:RNA ligase